ncbi:MAG: EthD family reductase [Ferruginibacter sp.]
MIKLTVLYGHPTDAEAFEKYYAETHLPIASKAPGILKVELTKFLPSPDGTAAAYYRLAELYFNNPDEMQQTMSSPEGQTMAADLANFATGGVTIMFGIVEN